MIPPEDAPPAARLSRWLAGWLEPRWRAVLTWVALAGLMGWLIFDPITAHWIERMGGVYFRAVNQAANSHLPGWLRYAPAIGTMFLCGCWFEPLLLRLDLFRGLAWIALRTLAPASVKVFAGGLSAFMAALVIGAALGLSVLVLRGWRSRPWMPVIAIPLMILVYCLLVISEITMPSWLLGAALAFPSAAVLLYGTRLLTPEERARREG
jgi:hypothetical protein